MLFRRLCALSRSDLLGTCSALWCSWPARPQEEVPLSNLQMLGEQNYATPSHHKATYCTPGVNSVISSSWKVPQLPALPYKGTFAQQWTEATPLSLLQSPSDLPQWAPIEHLIPLLIQIGRLCHEAVKQKRTESLWCVTVKDSDVRLTESWLDWVYSGYILIKQRQFDEDERMNRQETQRRYEYGTWRMSHSDNRNEWMVAHECVQVCLGGREVGISWPTNKDNMQ